MSSTEEKINHKNIKTNFIKLFFEYMGIFILFFLLSFTIINYQSLAIKLAYYWQSNFYRSTLVQNLPFSDSNPEKLPQNRMYIPKIKLDAPIQWNVSQQNIDHSLLNGLSHYDVTTLPGEIGNIFITGHSSYYSWVKSDYKNVFALLGDLDVNDEIYITYNKNIYTYKVREKKIVSPYDLSLLDSTKDKHLLTLVTCTPVGTNLKRLVIVAEEI